MNQLKRGSPEYLLITILTNNHPYRIWVTHFVGDLVDLSYSLPSKDLSEGVLAHTLGVFFKACKTYI